MFLNQQRAFATATQLLNKARELEAAAIFLLVLSSAKEFRVRLHHIKGQSLFILLR